MVVHWIRPILVLFVCLAVQLGFGLLRLIWLLGPVEIGSCCASMTGHSPLPLHNMVVDQFQVVFVCLAAHIFVFDWLLRAARHTHYKV